MGMKSAFIGLEDVQPWKWSFYVCLPKHYHDVSSLRITLGSHAESPCPA